MSKKSYLSDTEKFYEGDWSDKPKLDHTMFTVSPNLDSEQQIDTEPIVLFLIENEERITAPWPASRAGHKRPTGDQCNKMLAIVYTHFKKRYKLMVVYNEIVEFFHLDYVKFYKQLGTGLRDMLQTELKNSMNLDSYKRIERKEQGKGGAIQPTFNKIL